MIAARCASLALFLTLLPGSALPTVAGPQDADKVRITRGDLQRAEMERMEKEIQGLWKIERIRLQNQEYQGRQLVGYLLAAPGYLTLEFHLENFPQDGGFDGVELMFQTGIFNYRFTPLQEIEMFGMIGTNNLNSNVAEWEPPGQRRKFRVTLSVDHMTLERKDAKLVMTRVSRPPHTTDKE